MCRLHSRPSSALSALRASVMVEGPKGVRRIAFDEFHRLPGDTPWLDTNLRPGELITRVELPAIPYARQSTYIKVRDRNSYAFALVSTAAIVDVDKASGMIRTAHITLGGVAHIPWRARLAEQYLAGKPAQPAVIRAAADMELREAHAYSGNAFKVELAKRTIVRAVTTAAGEA